MALDAKVSVVEITGAPQFQVAEKLNEHNMKNNLNYDVAEKQKNYLKQELKLQKKVIKAEQEEPEYHVPLYDEMRMPEVAIPRKRIELEDDYISDLKYKAKEPLLQKPTLSSRHSSRSRISPYRQDRLSPLRQERNNFQTVESSEAAISIGSTDQYEPLTAL